MSASVLHSHSSLPAPSTAAAVDTEDVTATRLTHRGYQLLGVTRIMVGFTFLWAFLDKLLGLGFSTPAEASWINGGSPTAGFLGASIEGGNPLSGVWEFFVGHAAVTNVLFMAGLLGIGLAFMLGIGTRIAAVSAAAMYFLMYLASFPMSSNPLFDDHLIMLVVVLALGAFAAGDHLGLGTQWSKLVKGNRFLV
ncbi:hypothetical protein [Brachybacterium sp. YJGR34]|uniref:hypothetical protein n=1 Tax=Brachybacterium sp. YJGR34 TaxID=2059911 RepID=UPI000E0A6A1A|nr:hypothetical protein [Brachybacterium sp. YJGR34]